MPDTRAVAMTHMGWEARCGWCGETFIPSGPEDTVHLVCENGEECGGEASDIFEWVQVRDHTNQRGETNV